jgi:hypothetical protein
MSKLVWTLLGVLKKNVVVMLGIFKGSQMHGNILIPFVLCDFKGMNPPSIASKRL